MRIWIQDLQMYRTRYAFAFAVVLWISTAEALEVAKVFTDHMVLQQKMPVAVWGKARAGSNVVVSFGGKDVAATADEKGGFRAKLPASPAIATPRELIVKGDGTEVRLKDVLVGEVWICSGQSNMEWQFTNIKRSAPESFPQIRYINRKKAKTAPVWKPIVRQRSQDCSLAAYYFATGLHKHLKVPVGIINVSVGGTKIATWQPLCAVKALGGCHRRSKAGVNYAAHVAPVAGFASRGLVWYQGESDAGFGKPNTYWCSLPQLILGWRKEWNRPDWPVIVVGLADFNGWRNFNVVRDAQIEVAAVMPNVEVAMIADRSKGLHPGDKTVVGERVLQAARKTVYGEKTVAGGPRITGAKQNGKSLVLQFADVGGGLVAKKKGPLSSHKEANAPFRIAGVDWKFFPADAVISGATVRVSSPEVPRPAVACYDTGQKPAFVLWNKDGFPALQGYSSWSMHQRMLGLRRFISMCTGVLQSVAKPGPGPNANRASALHSLRKLEAEYKRIGLRGQAPQAHIAISQDGRTVKVDAAGSTDKDGFITGVFWDFGRYQAELHKKGYRLNGGVAAGWQTSYTYPAAGTFKITLTVLDNAGNATRHVQEVTIP